jgi:Mrp family chromosome partitioning ATPase
MGRMFRIITGGGSESLSDANDGGTLTADPFAPDDVPFVEVGGPEGVVTSIPAPPAVIPVPPRPAPLPEPDEVELDEEPLPVSDARVLSVAFHRFPKTGLRLLPTGVAPEVVAYHHPDHPISGEYHAVRDEIRRQFEEHGPRVVLFTAASPVAGTTTVLLNFAVALTQESAARVLVLDANFDRPALARRLGVAETPGLAEVLGQMVPLAWALQPTAVENLHALAAGVPADDTARAMTTDFPRLLAQLRQWFDWVLVDVGVWEESLGQESAGPACDAVYLVTRQADIDRPEFAGLRASVASSGGLLRGYITTRQ